MMNNALKLLLTGSFLSALVMPLQAETKPEQERNFQISYRLLLAENGNIESLTLQNEAIKGVLAENIEKQVRSWTYIPGSVDGKPARTETNLWLTVKAKPDVNGNYVLRIADAGTGAKAAKGGMATAPRYPIDSLRLGHEAVLRLLVTYDSNGIVTKAERPGQKIKGFLPFEKASFDAAKKWRFDPEKMNGIGVPGQVIVPISFCIPPSNCASLLKGSKEKEKLAQEVAQQTVPIGSRVAIQRQAQLN